MQGGPTLKQVYSLFENIQKSKRLELTFLAGIHGVDLQGGSNAPVKNNHTDIKSSVPFFGAPEDYENLSASEKEDITTKMLNKHKNWSKGALK